jgi:hypothetical protein
MLFRYFRALTRLSDLEDRVETLERGQKGLELEWSDTFDNLRRVLGKISKRASREAAGETATAEDAPGSTMADEQVGDPYSVQVRAFRRRGA